MKILIRRDSKSYFNIHFLQEKISDRIVFHLTSSNLQIPRKFLKRKFFWVFCSFYIQNAGYTHFYVMPFR